MDVFGKLIRYGTNWIIDGAHKGAWLQVAIGLAVIGFGIGGIIYAIKVFDLAFKSGEKGVDLSSWELFNAAFRGDKKMVLMKLNEKVNINKQDRDGLTPLMYACSSQQPQDDVVHLLLEKGADLNIRDKDGGTALMHAVKQGHIDIARILVNSGSDAHAIAKDSITTALKIAKENNNPDMVALIEMAPVISKQPDVEVTTPKPEPKPQALSCPECGWKYQVADYQADAQAWFCSSCRNPLPKSEG